MQNLTINPEFGSRVISFGKTSKQVKDMTQSELQELALIAQSSKNPVLLEVFNTSTPLPSASDIKANLTAEQIAELDGE